MVRTYRDLVVWQKAMQMVRQVYRVTKAFPREEAYGLTSQVRRAAVSVPSNIAEGYARSTDGDFVRFLRMACGSVYEMQTQLEIARGLDYLGQKELEAALGVSVEVEKMLSALIGKVKGQKSS